MACLKRLRCALPISSACTVFAVRVRHDCIYVFDWNVSEKFIFTPLRRTKMSSTFQNKWKVLTSKIVEVSYVELIGLNNWNKQMSNGYYFMREPPLPLAAR